MRFARLLLTAACLLGTNGCALRATTDFGPGDEPHHQFIGAGVGPFPNALSSDGRNGISPSGVTDPTSGSANSR